MIKLAFVFWLMAACFGAYAVMGALDRTHPKRFSNAAFWGLVAVSFGFGDRIGDIGNGVIVLALALIAGLGGLGRGQPATPLEEREAQAQRFGDRLFIPALALPLLLVFALFVLKPLTVFGQPLMDPKQGTLVCLGLAALASVLLALVMLRQPPCAPFQEGRRLIDLIGWAGILPQMLAALGAVFALAGVGQTLGGLITGWLPMDAKLLAVIVYGGGMALFTMLMGNAFAAFPVMTAAVGIPVLVRHFGGDPAVVCSLGMLSGFCGTLVTPLAANFNLVPANLLELKDRYGVIKAQAPAAALLLIANLGILYAFAFPK
jgi:uncharacterized membrane protein